MFRTGLGHRQKWWTFVVRAVWILLLLTSVAMFAFRVLAVTRGALYGTYPISLVDTAATGVLLFAIAGLYRFWSSSPRETVPTRSWADGLTALSLVVAALVAVLPVVNLLSPPTPPQVSIPACPSTRTWNATYVAITAGGDGNNTRKGPARSFESNGRFPQGCSVGFSAYCLGESVRDPIVSTPQSAWVNNRWLVVSTWKDGLWARVARSLSGEQEITRMVSDSTMVSATAYNELKSGPECGQVPLKTPEPGRTVLRALDLGRPAGTSQLLTAQADHAPNMGFATWIAPDQPFIEAGQYRQIFNPSATTAENPGEADASGTKSVVWPYQKTLVNQLRPEATSGLVTVLATPCAAVNVPMGSPDRAIYLVTRSGPPQLVLLPTQSLQPDLELLKRTACQART